MDAVPVNFTARYRLESIDGKSKLIDLKTGEDISRFVGSIAIEVDSEGPRASVRLCPSVVDIVVEIPEDVRPVPFS